MPIGANGDIPIGMPCQNRILPGMRLIAAILITALLHGYAAAEEQPTETVTVDETLIVLEEAPPEDEASEEEKASYWERVRQQYESAKAKGSEWADKTQEASGELMDKARDSTNEWYEQARDWTKEDIGKAGTWQYRVITVWNKDVARGPEQVEAMFNALGKERYECFWVEPIDQNRMAFFFKKSGVSFIRSIPAKEFWRFLPSGGDSNDGSSSD